MGRRKTKSKGGKKRHDAGTIFSGIKRPGKLMEAQDENNEVKDADVEEEVENERAGDSKQATDTKPALKGKFSVDQILDKVEEYLDEFNHEMARRFCERALQIDPNNIRALETAGAVLLEMDDINNAKQCFGRAITLEPERGHAKYMYMGQLLTGQDAISSFMRGVAIMNKELEGQQAATNMDGEITTYDISNAYCSIAEIYLTDECMLEDAEDQCRTSLEKAITANPNNPEAHQLMASFWLSEDDKQKARESIERSVSLWLPRLREADKPDGGKVDPVDLCNVPYPARVSCSKILIEVGNYDCASEVLELLLDEEDQVVEVWYLLGWLNYLQKDEYLSNARFYLARAQEVAVKTQFDDYEMLSHIAHLVEELGPELEIPEGENGADEEDDYDDDDDDMEAQVTSNPEAEMTQNPESMAL